MWYPTKSDELPHLGFPDPCSHLLVYLSGRKRSSIILTAEDFGEKSPTSTTLSCPRSTKKVRRYYSKPLPRVPEALTFFSPKYGSRVCHITLFFTRFPVAYKHLFSNSTRRTFYYFTIVYAMLCS